MSEWWTYRLSDFLMFSPRTYWRLVELYNRELWPAQWFALAAGVAAMVLAGRRGPHRAAANVGLALLLALAWAWVGWAFHWQRYATINTAAPYLACAFALQAALFGASAAAQASVHTLDAAGTGTRHASRPIGWVLVAAGVAAYPLLAVVLGRPWSQAELFGLMPEPTALATVGLLLVTGHRHARWLVVIPLASLALGLATLCTMAS